MALSFIPGRSAIELRRVIAGLGIAAALLFALTGAVHAADAKEVSLSKEDKACLECHARADLSKTLANGERLSLAIGEKAFARSVHASSGCEGCHAEIDLATHARQPRPIASRRAVALERMETCRDCHKKTVKLYEDSVHSALVREGSEKAPLCSDCHNPHATRSASEKTAGGAEPVVCQKCHQEIAKAFVTSIHGRTGEEALECKDCHQTHNIKAASLGQVMKGQCTSCHKDVATTHAAWLPNTERHLEAISCPACHSPGTTRRVNLRLYEGGDAPQQSVGKIGVPTFVRMAHAADSSGMGLDARALWSLLQEFNSDATAGRVVLRGRLEVQTGVQAHLLAEKALAVADCDTCHRAGAASFQSVSITMAGPDGRPVRHDASRGALTAVESIGSVGGFYAIGSTRIKLLDTLLVMALGAGIGLPLVHLSVKLASERKHRRRAASHAEGGADSPDARS